MFLLRTEEQEQEEEEEATITPSTEILFKDIFPTRG